MFTSKTSHHSTDKLHKRALQVMHNDYTLTYDDLIEIDNSVTIHVRNVQLLMTEICKTLNNLNLPHLEGVGLRMLESRMHRKGSRFLRRGNSP